MSNKLINLVAAGLFYAAGVATVWAIVRFSAVPAAKTEPSYVGVYYTDNWNTKESEKIEINADGTCRLPGDWHSLTNSECSYTVDGNEVYFYDSKTIHATVGADGLVYGTYYFRRLK